jgi:hypothetical protein
MAGRDYREWGAGRVRMGSRPGWGLLLRWIWRSMASGTGSMVAGLLSSRSRSASFIFASPSCSSDRGPHAGAGELTSGCAPILSGRAGGERQRRLASVSTTDDQPCPGIKPACRVTRRNHLRIRDSRKSRSDRRGAIAQGDDLAAQFAGPVRGGPGGGAPVARQGHGAALRPVGDGGGGGRVQ